MKPHYLRLIVLTIAVIGVGSLFQNCSNANFSPEEASLDNPNNSITGNGGGGGGGSIPVVCDPFDKKNIVDAQSGIEGRIYSAASRLDRSSCAGSQCSSRDYIAQGEKINAALFMNRIFVPTRDFTQGFDVNGSNPLTDANNNTLIEWFALDLQSNFILKDSDSEGLYQFAVISDDGATLSVAGQDILVSEGEHAPELACASQVTAIKKGDMIPFRLTYFQGPRTQISLILLWRKISAGQSLGGCGTSDGYISSADSLPSSLANKGWKVLQPGNFRLSTGKNLCAGM